MTLVYTMNQEAIIVSLPTKPGNLEQFLANFKCCNRMNKRSRWLSSNVVQLQIILKASCFKTPDKFYGRLLILDFPLKRHLIIFSWFAVVSRCLFVFQFRVKIPSKLIQQAMCFVISGRGLRLIPTNQLDDQGRTVNVSFRPGDSPDSHFF